MILNSHLEYKTSTSRFQDRSVMILWQIKVSKATRDMLTLTWKIKKTITIIISNTTLVSWVDKRKYLQPTFLTTIILDNPSKIKLVLTRKMIMTNTIMVIKTTLCTRKYLISGILDQPYPKVNGQNLNILITIRLIKRVRRPFLVCRISKKHDMDHKHKYKDKNLKAKALTIAHPGVSLLILSNMTLIGTFRLRACMVSLRQALWRNFHQIVDFRADHLQKVIKTTPTKSMKLLRDL